MHAYPPSLQKPEAIEKRVLITGAGRGLGRAIATAFLEAGFFVVATDADENLLSELKARQNLMALKMDVTSADEVEKCAKTVRKNLGTLDVVVSNAGIFDFYPVSEAGAERLSAMFAVNVFGLANLTKFFTPLMPDGQGCVIAISSESYRVPAPFQPYAVSKQALEAVYRAIKTELSLKGIRCILIRPGAIKTKILEEALRPDRRLTDSIFDKEFSAFVKTVPAYIGKTAEPAGVAALVLKAATSKRPKAVYNINHNPAVKLLSLLPSRLKHFLITRKLKQDKP